MDERANGIILRTRPLTETSLIVHWLTDAAGRVATVAKGARRPKSPFRGKLDLFHLAEFSFVRSRRSELHILREVELRATFPALRQDLGRLRQVAYGAALIEQTTETETPLDNLFPLFHSLIRHVNTQAADAKTVFAFELKLLNELGLAPDLTDVQLDPGARRVLQRLMADDWPALAPLKLSPAQVADIRHYLHGFLLYHLDRIPPGRSRALEG